MRALTMVMVVLGLLAVMGLLAVGGCKSEPKAVPIANPPTAVNPSNMPAPGTPAATAPAAATPAAGNTATCPVCGMSMDKDKMVAVEQDGKTVYACSDGCATEIKASPDKYGKDTAGPADDDKTAVCPGCGMAMDKDKMIAVEKDGKTVYACGESCAVKIRGGSGK